MWKLRIGAFVTSGLLGLCLSPGAWASASPNAGDVWVDSHGLAGGPGHEMDPHLPCQDIDLWGSGLSDSSGSFAVDGWAPSGSQDIDYSGAWSYTQPGAHVIAVITISDLISQAEANGDRAPAQGFHFKLDFSQDPQKHKTFWVDCPGSSPAGGTPPSGTTSTGSVSSPPVTVNSTGPVKTAIGAVRIARKRRKVRKHHKPIHPARHHKPRRRHVRAVHIRDPSFTG